MSAAVSSVACADPDSMTLLNSFAWIDGPWSMRPKTPTAALPELIPYGGWVVKGGSPRARAARCTGRPLPRQGCCASLRDGLRPPLTREPLPALGQALSGRPWPARWVRAARARSSGLTGCGYPRRIVGGRVASFVDVAFSGVRVTCHAAVCGLLRGLPPLLLVVGC